MNIYSALVNKDAGFAEVVVPGIQPLVWHRASQLVANGRVDRAAAAALAKAAPARSKVMLNVQEDFGDIRTSKPENVDFWISEKVAAAEIYRAAGHRVGFYDGLQPRRYMSLRSWIQANDYSHVRQVGRAKLLDACDLIFAPVYAETTSINAELRETFAATIAEAIRIAGSACEVIVVLCPHTRDSKRTFSGVPDLLYACNEMDISAAVWSDQAASKQTRGVMDIAAAKYGRIAA